MRVLGNVGTIGMGQISDKLGQNERSLEENGRMKFSHCNGKGFVVTRYIPNEDGAVRVFIAASVQDDDADPDDSADGIEVEVEVKLSPNASLQQIEKAVRKRARLILEAAIAVIDPDETS